MLGAWIDCKNAWTNLEPNHDIESEANAAEIDRAVELANKYSDIVKIIAVGNEAMVKWATSYYVQPAVILKWVNHLQELKKTDKLPADLWITSSDNFASWGGGEDQYHVPDLEKLIKAVDYISMHTYPMHDTHYNPIFWGSLKFENALTKEEKINAIMNRALNYAKTQYNSVENYMKSLGINKPIHIGETGWASFSNFHYGDEGSQATDEYKEALFYNYMRNWTNSAGISCFYFEAFDEQWKDAKNPLGSENHFGLFTLNGQAKYALWNLVDKNAFKGLTRNGNPITKTFNGNKEELMKTVLIPLKN
jgi:exo-beta-1,3-glucanase (GH17 family)